MKALATVLFTLGVGLGLIAGFVFFAAWSDAGARGCPGAAECSDAYSIMVVTACAMVAALVMMLAAVVFAGR